MGDQSRVLPDQRAALRCLAWMAQDEPFDPDLRGQIVVVEARDSLEDISSAVGFEILINSISSCRFSNSGYVPSFEERSAYYEPAFAFGDDDIVIFIPKGVKKSRCSRSRLKLRLAFGRVRCRPYQASSQTCFFALGLHFLPPFSPAQISPC
jgi:hypothetical protein